MSEHAAPTELYFALKKRLKEHRIKRGWSPADLCRKGKVGFSALTFHEKESSTQSQVHTTISIAQALELDEGWHGLLATALNEASNRVRESHLTYDDVMLRLSFLLSEQSQSIKKQTNTYLSEYAMAELRAMNVQQMLELLSSIDQKHAFLTQFLDPRDFQGTNEQVETDYEYDRFLISSFVKRQRVSAGISVASLASQVGVTEFQISALEYDASVRFEVLVKVLLVLQTFQSNFVLLKFLPMTNTIGDRLQQLLNFRLVTHAQLAKLTKLKVHAVSDIVQNKNYFLLNLVRVMFALGVEKELHHLFLNPNQRTVCVLKEQVAKFDNADCIKLSLALADAVRMRREYMEKTIQQIAKETDLSVDRLKRFEKTGEIMLKQFVTLAQYFGVIKKVANLFHQDNQEEFQGDVDTTVNRLIGFLSVVRRDKDITYRDIAKQCDIRLTSLTNIFANNICSLHSFVQIACLFGLADTLRDLVEAIQPGDAPVRPAQIGENEVPYAIFIGAYKKIRKSLGLNQADMQLANNKNSLDAYERFERQGIISIANWISVNSQFGLLDRMFEIFGNKFFHDLPLTMSRDQLMLLLVGQRLRMLREAKCWNRSELARLASIDERVVFNIEDGLGGKLSTLFELFQLLGKSHELMMVVSPQTTYVPSEQEDVIAYQRARAACIVLADQFKTLRTEKGWSQTNLMELSDVTALKIDRFENSGMATLANFVAIANVTHPTATALVLSPVGCSYGVNWQKELKAACAKKRRELRLDELAVATAAGIHIRELSRFEAIGAISLEALLALYQVLMPKFDMNSWMKEISQLSSGRQVQGRVPSYATGWPVGVDIARTMPQNWVAS